MGRGLGQFADLREGAWQERGGGVDTRIRTMEYPKTFSHISWFYDLKYVYVVPWRKTAITPDRRIAQYCCLQVWLKADLDPWDKENWCYISFFYALKNIWGAQKKHRRLIFFILDENAEICKTRDLKFVRKVASGSSFLSYIRYIILHQNRLCNIFLHLDWQVIMNHFPFFHSEWVCLNARIFFYFLFL